MARIAVMAFPIFGGNVLRSDCRPVSQASRTLGHRQRFANTMRWNFACAPGIRGSDSRVADVHSTRCELTTNTVRTALGPLRKGRAVWCALAQLRFPDLASS
jgi:hypothetical protein